jgi:hypothetical protein
MVAFLATPFSVALTIAWPTASSTTFFADSFAQGLPDSNFNLLDSFFVLTHFVIHAEVPRLTI